MARKTIDVVAYASEILKGVQDGALITTKRGDEVNAMTISWGTLGIEWNRLIFTTFVRTGRHTHKMLEDTFEFTVNIGTGGKAGKIRGICGTKTGATTNKIKELGLTLVTGDKIGVPGIVEMPLTLECKVIYRQLQDPLSIPGSFKESFYPHDVPSDFHGANRDFHTAFYGEIIGAYRAS